MKLAKLGLAAIAIIVGAAGSAFTTKVKATHVMAQNYSWFNVLSSGATGSFIIKNTLAAEKSRSGLFTLSPGHSTVKKEYGFTTAHATTPRDITLYQ